MKYYVDLMRIQCLDRREVEAKTEKEAKEKAIGTFNKYDIDDYDYMEVRVAECGCLAKKCDCNEGV
jgi:hypothetical protein